MPDVNLRFAPLAMCLLACTPVGPSSTAAPATVDAPAQTRPETEAEPPAEPAPAAEPTPGAAPEPDAGHGVLHEDLNARYEEETDVDQWRDRFESGSREVRAKQKQILAEVGLAKGERIADIGAGTGLYTFPFAKAVGKSGVVYAVDVQNYFLEYLEAQAKQRHLPQIQTIKASQTAVSLPDASIDVAFLCDAYHHIEHPAPYLESVRAALRPGGRLVVVDYAKVDGAKAFIQHHLRDTPETFRAEIEAAGFRFVRSADFLDENFLFVFERPQAE